MSMFGCSPSVLARCRNTGVEGAQEAFRAVSEAYEVQRASPTTALHLNAASPLLLCAPPGPPSESCTSHAPLQVLRDEHKRAAYDARRRGGGGSFGMGSPAAAASGAWRPGASEFDEFFANWFERQGCAIPLQRCWVLLGHAVRALALRVHALS